MAKAGTPERCPGYTCVIGRVWAEAKAPGDHPPGHYWYAAGGYLAHEGAEKRLRLAAAALEAALSLADEFDAEDGVLPEAVGEDAVLAGRPVTRGDRMREAISAALAGEGSGDD